MCLFLGLSGVMAQAFSFNIEESKAGESPRVQDSPDMHRVPSQSRLHGETLLRNKQASKKTIMYTLS